MFLDDPIFASEFSPFDMTDSRIIIQLLDCPMDTTLSRLTHMFSRRTTIARTCMRQLHRHSQMIRDDIRVIMYNMSTNSKYTLALLLFP